MRSRSMDSTMQPDTADIQRETLRKIRNRCVLPLLFAFVISYLDRVNVGFAAITANHDLGLTAAQYGWGAGLLFLGYSFFELPSNLALERFGARRWLARIMITWGLLGCGMALVTGPLSFYMLRFLLGVAEAGLFPGVILYLTYWLPRSLRARYLGLFALGIPLSSVIGAPISGVIMSATHGLLGLKNWQWLFLLEAIPAVLLGLWVLDFARRPAGESEMAHRCGTRLAARRVRARSEWCTRGVTWILVARPHGSEGAHPCGRVLPDRRSELRAQSLAASDRQELRRQPHRDRAAFRRALRALAVSPWCIGAAAPTRGRNVCGTPWCRLRLRASR